MSAKSWIISIISVLAIAIAGISLYIFWPAITGTVKGSKYYTAEEVQQSYDKGFNDGNESKTEMQEKIDYYSDLVDQYYLEVETLNARINEVNAENTELQGEITELNRVKTENESTIASLTETNKQNEKAIETANSEITRLTKEVADLTQSGQDKDETIKSKNAQIENLQTLVSQLQATNAANNQIIQDLTGQVLALNNQIKELTLQVGTNNNDIIALNTEIASLKKSVAYYENYILELESQNHTVAVFEFDGSVYKIVEIGEDMLAHVDNPESTDYVIFNYWMVNNEQVNLDSYQVKENTKFVANVTYKYKVKFMVDEDEKYTQTVTKGQYASPVENPTKDKYEFKGWSIDGVNVIDINSYEINTDTTFIAIFSVKYGLFNPDNNNLIYNWEELQNYNYIKIDAGILSAGENSHRFFGNLILDDEVTEISNETFSNCSALTGITIPTSVKKIGQDCFGACSGLKYVNYLGTVEDWAKISFGNVLANPLAARVSIGNYLFGGFSLSSNWYELINDLLINGENNQINFVGNEVKSYAFSCCKNFVSVNSTFENVESFSFAYLPNLTTVTVTGQITEMPGYMFYQSSNIENLSLPNTITKVGDYAFSKCSKIKDLEFIPNLTEIGKYAFEGCESFTKLDITNKTKSIGSSAFADCTNVSILNYDAAEPSFDYCPFKSLGVKSSTGVKVTIGPNVTEIKDYMFDGSMDDSPAVTEIVFEGAITSIGKYSFEDCYTLKSITLPKSLKSIGYSAFWGCENLVEIVNLSDFKLTAGSSTSSMGYVSKYALYILTDSSQSKIETKNGVYYIPSGDDYYAIGPVDRTCESLTFDENTTIVNDYAFCHLSNLKHVTFSNKTTKIGGGAFCYTDLQEVIIPDSVLTIGDSSFRYTYHIKEIVIGSSVQAVYSNAFLHCYDLESVTIKSAELYKKLTSDSSTTNGSVIYNVKQGDVIKVLKSIVDDEANTNAFLNDTSNYTKTDGGDYYVYTRV